MDQENKLYDTTQKFLEMNDFKVTNDLDDNPILERYYDVVLKNEHCVVGLSETNYVVIKNEGYMYSHDLSVYWLIGVLTYDGLMDRNYKMF
jgi:hypothetical protein